MGTMGRRGQDFAEVQDFTQHRPSSGVCADFQHSASRPAHSLHKGTEVWGPWDKDRQREGVLEAPCRRALPESVFLHPGGVFCVSLQMLLLKTDSSQACHSRLTRRSGHGDARAEHVRGVRGPRSESPPQMTRVSPVARSVSLAVNTPGHTGEAGRRRRLLLQAASPG